MYADYITTVSPTYAREICESPGGMGLEGLLSQRRERLVGILNGIDSSVWNPATDPYLEHRYDAGVPDSKALNKSALQQALGLPARDDCPLVGIVGRLVEQKGLELILPVLKRFWPARPSWWCWVPVIATTSSNCRLLPRHTRDHGAGAGL